MTEQLSKYRMEKDMKENQSKCSQLTTYLSSKGSQMPSDVLPLNFLWSVIMSQKRFMSPLNSGAYACGHIDSAMPPPLSFMLQSFTISWRERRKVSNSKSAVANRAEQSRQKGDGMFLLPPPQRHAWSFLWGQKRDLGRNQLSLLGSSIPPWNMAVPQRASHVMCVSCHWAKLQSYKVTAKLQSQGILQVVKHARSRVIRKVPADTRRIKTMTFPFPSLHLHSIPFSFSSISSKMQLESAVGCGKINAKKNV